MYSLGIVLNFLFLPFCKEFCQYLHLENGNIGCDENTPIFIGSRCAVTCDEGYLSSVSFIECEDEDTWTQIPICQGKQANI